MAAFPRISFDAAVMNGQPCIDGTRLTVRRVLELLVIYPDRHELKREFPELDDSAINEALEFVGANGG